MFDSLKRMLSYVNYHFSSVFKFDAYDLLLLMFTFISYPEKISKNLMCSS